MVFQTERAAMLLYQSLLVGVELFSFLNTFLCSNKFASMLASWEKTLHLKTSKKTEKIINIAVDINANRNREVSVQGLLLHRFSKKFS